MYLPIVGASLLIILIEVSYVLVGQRKKIIDQFESDVRIFLVIVLIISSYLLFLSMSSLYCRFFIGSHQLKFAFFALYFLIPPFLGIFLYTILPSLCGRNLHLRDGDPDSVLKIGNLLGLTDLPVVKTTSLQIPPLVYGRRGKTSIFVLPENTLLTEEEQKAVIAHELSHIKQGDVGFFTWLTLLTEAFTYWIIPFPLVMYLSPFNLINLGNTVFVVFIPLFFVSLILLKASLSRTRESIADAYVVFHERGAPLKSALYKYAAFKTSKRSGLKFLHEPPFLKSILATHPPLSKRLRDIEEKTYLTETTKNLSSELALWTGMAAAFLYYALFSVIINFEVAFNLPLLGDSASFIFTALLFLSAANVVSAAYVLPITKASVLFLDLGDSKIVYPLIRNMGITLVTAAFVSYGLSLSLYLTWASVSTVLGGFLFLFMGFAAARPSDFAHETRYLLLIPVFWFVVLWYPLQVVNTFFGRTGILPFAVSQLVVIVLGLLVWLIFMVNGQLRTTKKERTLVLFGRMMEFPGLSGGFFIFAVLSVSLIAVLISFNVYVFSCFFDTLEIVPVKNILTYGIIVILLIYGLKKSDILFFYGIAFLADISSVRNIDEEDSIFIQKVIEKYQSPDGGFDYAGLGFSCQKDTYHFVKTAKLTGIALDTKRVVEWIHSTDRKGGFALFAGGCSRMEGLYYAVKSLQLLGKTEEMGEHTEWVCSHFNSEWFTFENDTDSLLVQTCYAVEVLATLGEVRRIDGKRCGKWIENQGIGMSSEEAFFVVRALKSLNWDLGLMEKWVERNKDLLSTRIDKNVENVYYYVGILRELERAVPSFVVDEALQELAEIRKEYEKVILPFSKTDRQLSRT